MALKTPDGNNAAVRMRSKLRRGGTRGVAPLGGGGTKPITAIVRPATSVLYVGDALNDTVNWTTFLSPANYVSEAGGNLTVVVNYIGDTATETETFEDLEFNHFSITVTDDLDAGNPVTFNTTRRLVLYQEAVNTVPPTLSGTTDFGDTLTITPGTWNNAVGGAFSYQFYRDGVPIEGATGLTYDLTYEDENTTIHATEQYSNSGGDVSEVTNDIVVGAYSAAVFYTFDAVNENNELILNYTVSRNSVADFVLYQAPTPELAETITVEQIRAGNGYGNQPAIQHFDDQAVTLAISAAQVDLIDGLGASNFYIAGALVNGSVSYVSGPLSFAT